MLKSMLCISILLTMLSFGIAFRGDCLSMGNKRSQDPPRLYLMRHKNWDLLPIGRCGKQNFPKNRARVYGGLDVNNPWEFPWMAQLSITGRGSGKIQCGGSVINERYVLTAGHCCKHINSKSIWLLGSHELLGSTFIVDIEKVIIHPEYEICPQTSFIKNDICLTRVKEKIPFSERLHAICLPIRYGRDDQEGLEMFIAGYGIIHFNWLQVGPLQYKKVKMIPQLQCRLKVSEEVDSREICHTYGNCDGDSGGPLMKYYSKNYNKTWYQFGVISSGARNCQMNNSISARVTEYMDWIVESLEP